MTSAGTPWVELYRPKSLEDVSHQSEVIATLQNAVETGRMPHLLFYGPPGSGKTSVALALCRQLWHPSDWKRRVLELNASDERGISVVRDKIKNFASLAVGKPQGASSFFKKTGEDSMDVDDEKKYPNPPFKIIILDEADTVTPDAQAALRRIIEAHSKITRFILICNYVTRVIEPLASRCAKFRFQALPPASMRDRLLTIAQAEGCSEQETALVDEILDQADGDMRRAVTTLQSVHSLAVGSQPLTKDTISEIAGLPPTAVMDELWKAFGTTFDSMQKTVESISADGYSAKLLLSTLLTKVIVDPVLSELDKAELAIRIAEAEKCMMDGADEYLQLLTVCSHALTCFSRSAKQ